jgi:predicted SprT family Zn-dependent metalloprotease
VKRPPSTLTQPALNLIVRSVLRRLGEERWAPRVRVVFNRRLRTAIGRSDPAGARIYLNPRLLDRYPRELVPTLVHELCHVVAGLDAGHGPRWKNLMERLGYPPDTYHAGAARGARQAADRLVASRPQSRRKRLRAVSARRPSPDAPPAAAGRASYCSTTRTTRRFCERPSREPLSATGADSP